MIYFFNLIKIAIDNKIKSIPITMSNILRILDNSKPELEVFILLTVADEFNEPVLEVLVEEEFVLSELELVLLFVLELLFVFPVEVVKLILSVKSSVIFKSTA